VGEAFTGMASGGCLSGPCDGMGVSTSGHKGTQGGAQVVGGGGQVAEHTKSGGKKEKKYIRTRTKMQVAHCVVHVQSTRGQVVCRGGLASSTQRNLAERDVENRAVSRDRR